MRPCSARSTRVRLISACGTGWFVGLLPTLTTSTSAGSRSSRPVAPSRSVTTTSAVARASSPATGTRPGSPGPLPTSTTRPRRLRRRRRSTSPDSTCGASASRTSATRRGSGSPSDTTPRARSPWVLVAATRAVPSRPSEALTHQVRRSSHHAATCAFSAGSAVAATTSQAPSTSASTTPRSDDLDVPVAGHPARVVARARGSTSTTRAPSSTRRRARRVPTDTGADDERRGGR